MQSVLKYPGSKGRVANWIVGHTGNAKEVTIEVEVQGGMIPAPEYEDGVAPTGEEGV